MKAVNLIPVDQRRRGAGTPGRSGLGVYLLLGGLAAALAILSAYVLIGNTVKDRRAELAQVTNEAAQAQAQAQALKPYTDFSDLRQKRVQTVASLAQSRFDWDRALRQLARVLPDNVWLSSLTGTVAPGVTLESGGGGGDTSSIRTALNVPAFEIVGCVPSQADVARVMARLRQMEHVQRVALSSSEKSDSSAGAGGGGASASGGASSSDGDCRHGSPSFPRFSIVIFFDAPAPATSSTATATPGQAPAAGATATASATTPAQPGQATPPPAAGGQTPPATPPVAPAPTSGAAK